MRQRHASPAFTTGGIVDLLLRNRASATTTGLKIYERLLFSDKTTQILHPLQTVKLICLIPKLHFQHSVLPNSPSSQIRQQSSL